MAFLKIIIFVLQTLIVTDYIFPQNGWFWQYPIPTGNVLYSVDFVDNNIALAVGSNGTILRSTDSGESWKTRNSHTRFWLCDVKFINQNVGWISGSTGSLSSLSLPHNSLFNLNCFWCGDSATPSFATSLPAENKQKNSCDVCASVTTQIVWMRQNACLPAVG